MTTNNNFSFEIIKQQINNETVNSVSARNLHNELGVKKDFSSWIKAQFKRGFFEENIDYVVFTQKGENLKGGRPSIDYIVTLDTAKEIAMMSGTQKGKEVRNYFIEVEKRFREQSQNSETEFDRELKAFNNSVEMLRVNGASKIKMLRIFHESKNLETSYLPEYSDENHTFSAKALLEKFEIKISVQQFNKKNDFFGIFGNQNSKKFKISN
jgi:phage anti-repressor protein